jgi:hypothetical protein
VNPYGRFELDMNSRLDLGLVAVSAVPGPRSPKEEAASAPCDTDLQAAEPSDATPVPTSLIVYLD